jgi:translation initiation factor IF-3
MFRGREQSRPELGYKLLQRLAEDVADIAFIEFAPKQDGRNMVMVLGPSRGGKPASLPKLVTTPAPAVVEEAVENSTEEVI